jgi:hypothetical protein
MSLSTLRYCARTATPAALMGVDTVCELSPGRERPQRFSVSSLSKDLEGGRIMFKINDGAAPHPALTRSWRMDRSTNELVGICRGVLADGDVNLTEARFLLDWLERHAEFIQHFPYSVLYPRIAEALADGVLDLDEERDLLEALTATVGGEVAHSNGANSLSAELPYDEPLPTILHSASVFVVTGTFMFGKRGAVCEAIEARHGVVRNAVSGSTDYVIVGEVGSRDWLHSSYGRKIQEAMDYRRQGKMISIVPERHWSASLRPLILDSPLEY